MSTPKRKRIGEEYTLQHTLVLLQLNIILTVDVRETPLAGDNDLLTTRELVASTTESLVDDRSVGILGADGENDLANVDTSDSTVWLAPRATHTSLQTTDAISADRSRFGVDDSLPISTSAGQHLVDTQDMEGVYTDPQMEGVLAGGLRDILVSTDTGGLKSFT